MVVPSWFCKVCQWVMPTAHHSIITTFGGKTILAFRRIGHNFCLPHTSVRQPLPQPEPTNGTGSAKQWRPCTPAMAAGLTDHVWSLREVLLFRVPPWHQLQTV